MFTVNSVMLFSLVACGTSGEREIVSKTDVVVPWDSIMAVRVSAGGSASGVSLANRIQARAMAELQAFGIVRRTVFPNDPAHFFMDIALADVDQVSDLGRLAFGAVAGRNELEALVKVFDSKTGKIVRQYRVQGESAALSIGNKRNDIEMAIAEFGAQIALGMKD